MRKSESIFAIFLFCFVLACGCGGRTAPENPVVECYTLSAKASGCLEKFDNIYNLSIVSNDDNAYKAEYNAGFIQGALQKERIIASRDNLLNIWYYNDPNHNFPTRLPPTTAELDLMQSLLLENFNYTMDYIKTTPDSDLASKMRRLLYRMAGVYNGVILNAPKEIPFDETWYPSFIPSDLQLNYGTATFSMMDLYFINLYSDLTYVIPPKLGLNAKTDSEKCSAFVKKTQDDIIITHNTWNGFFAQTMALNLYVNGDFVSANIRMPGNLSSMTDFGFNNKGIMFNETTTPNPNSQPEIDALWMFWRSAVAEQFADSLDSFYNYIALEPSGTYMNGYMIADIKTGEIGLVEMSWDSFVYFKSNGAGGYSIITNPDGLSKEYDTELLTPDYIIGVNYPISTYIKNELGSKDNRPARRRQFLEMIGDVKDIESAKSLITYTDNSNPLSIYGRWDLGYGETTTPKQIPNGSIDAKALSASMIAYTLNLQGILDKNSTNTGFWMRYGTTSINGKPFIWSESLWSNAVHRFVPDVVAGEFQLLKIRIK